MKKIKIPAICLAILLLFSGCGESGPSTTAPATDPTVQTTAETTRPEVTTEPVKETVYKDGSYEGIGYGNNGAIQVKIEISGDRIVELEVVNQGETADIFGRAWEGVHAALMEQETPELSEVDTVSGATNSSNGIIDAVKAALYKARK